MIASGGALLRPGVWTGIVADALGAPRVVSREAEASSRGAAVLVLARLGQTLPPARPTGAVVAPDSSRHEVYRGALDRQRRLYEIVVGPRAS